MTTAVEGAREVEPEVASEPGDAEVIACVEAGEFRGAIALCARDHALCIGRFCMATLADHEDAEDLVQALVVARMTGQKVRGTVRLSGTVAGRHFEQRYPLELESTTASGNAFVPRLYAATRIADLERQPSEANRKEIVALSSAFSVASRHTSLLVLERLSGRVGAAGFRCDVCGSAAECTTGTHL